MQVFLRSDSTGRVVAQAMTDAGGNFELRDLRAGAYVVHTELAGYGAPENSVALEAGTRYAWVVRLLRNESRF